MSAIPCPCCGRPLVSQLTVDETIVAAKLAPIMAEILRILTDAKGHWVSSSELVAKLYPSGGPVEAQGAIRVHVHHMRKLLATFDPAHPVLPGEATPPPVRVPCPRPSVLTVTSVCGTP